MLVLRFKRHDRRPNMKTKTYIVKKDRVCFFIGIIQHRRLKNTQLERENRESWRDRHSNTQTKIARNIRKKEKKNEIQETEKADN